MIIREIEKKDNEQVEQLIRTCLIEFGANRAGCAWEDPHLGSFYEAYQQENCKYWVVEKNGKVVGGCGIGPVEQAPEVCELQKMYCYKELRGTGIAEQLLKISIAFARQHYRKCYLETFSNMEAANQFYFKHGFMPLEKPLIESQHYACDRWYIKDIK